MPPAPASIAANVDALRERIARAAARSGRKVEDVTLVGISKTFPASAIRAAFEAGIRHFGENRVQEWESKRAEVADLLATWHLVGHLQSNKARRAATLFSSVDSLDSLDLARRLDAAVPAVAPTGIYPDIVGRPASHSSSPTFPVPRLRVLLEVRLSTEETKTGADAGDLETLARSVLALPHLELAGLMCIPPFAENQEQARPFFRRLRELRDALQSTLAKESAARAAAVRDKALLSVLSMGMSHDFEVAIEEGATEVRIGTALFGSR